MMDMERRTVLKTMAAVPVAALLMDPKLVKAAADSMQTVETKLNDGKTVKAALALPGKTPAPAVLLIHEWTGLNDQIKGMARAFANAGYVALAVDLYDGKVATSVDEAKQYMGAVNPDVASQTLSKWIEWLRGSDKVSGKVATCGWCYGGGWSLKASIDSEVEATVIYYGAVTRDATELEWLKGPVLGHFGTLDKNINAEMVGKFEQEMEKAGKRDLLTVHWYEANHAFANATGGRYDEEDANLAWARTMDFLKANLGG